MTPRQKAAFGTWAKRLYTFQRIWIGETADFAACVKARQIGFSHATAAGCVANALLRKRPQIVLSASQDLSDEVLDKARAHAAILGALGFDGATAFTANNATEIAWRSGGRVLALPANPRTARSFTGDVWLDEFAYHQDPEGIRDGAFPMASRGGWQVRVFSTPNGAQGLFYEWAEQSPPAGWTVHRVSVDDAIADGLRIDQDRLWSLCGGDERLFAQWYRCRFLDADLQYVPTALAERARTWSGMLPSIVGAEIHAGLDVGRTHDLTVLSIVAVRGPVAWVVANLTCKRTAFRDQRKMIFDAREAFRWSTLHVDETGLGKQLAEELVEAWGDEEVRPVTFTNEAKADLATRALRWLRDSRVRYPRGAEGEALYAETIAVRRKVTPAGNVVFDVPRTSKGHGDRWWAMCLALKGAGEPMNPRGMGQEPLLAVA